MTGFGMMRHKNEEFPVKTGGSVKGGAMGPVRKRH